MNIITSNNLATVAASAQQAYSNPSSPPGGGEVGPSSRPAPIDGLENTFSDDAKDSLFAKANEMKNAGASDDDIKSFVNRELETNSDDTSTDSQQTGRLIDILV